MNKPLPAPVEVSLPEVNQALVELCAAVLPVWGRQLVTSRSQSEVAVSQMLGAFAEIGPHLDMATRQSRQVTAALAQGEGGITQLAQACENELAPVLGQLDAQAAQAVQKVIAMIHQAVDALEQIAKPFVHETELVSAQVERMYIGFQYQDRISQMIALLESDMARLQDAVAGRAADTPELQAWLARLEDQYAMAEQRHNHHGGADSGADADNETTFF